MLDELTLSVGLKKMHPPCFSGFMMVNRQTTKQGGFKGRADHEARVA